jgi:2-polyprenyl-6-methoxyphenol hydroxylase-like FAD-dependent oxidoreductase
MPRIGIVGGGVAGTQLGLFLRKHGIAATIYSEKTPAQHLAARLSNVVCRSGTTRARERVLGIDHWDELAPDLVQFVVTVNGPRPLEFSGALSPASHVVDMRIYWARLLDDFTAAGR